tara:strand:+ start:103 stop:561 length:459 start_codon:yes stop_codon:yes gene_type:complete
LAKPSLKITSNFSFQKLAKNLNAVIKDSNLDISTSIAKNSKKNILDGVPPALRPSTLRQRRVGASSFPGHKPSATTETRPLLYSKRLFDSIKGVEEGLEIMEYGPMHNDGPQTGTKGTIPQRKFIAEVQDNKEDLEKIESALVKRMEKAMRK